MPMLWLILKILGIWTLISFLFAFLWGGVLNLYSSRCFFHRWNRRLAAATDGYEYYECLTCRIREAERIDGIEGEYPVNYAWLKGKGWF